MAPDGFAKLVAKAGFLAALTTFIFVASNSQASLPVKQIKDRLLGHPFGL